MARVTRALLLCCSLVVIVPFSPTPAAGQARGSLELVAQSGWVDDGGIFDLQVRVAGATSDSSVLLRVHSPITARRALWRDLPRDVEPLLDLEPVPLGELQETSNEVLSFEIAIVGPRTAEPDPTPEIVDEDPESEAAIPILRTEGLSAVYPVEIVLQNRDGEVADEIVTYLIELPRGRNSPPLQVVIVFPVELPLGLTELGTSELPETSGQELRTLLDAMSIHPDMPLTVDIAPESLTALGRSAVPEHQEMLASMRELLQPDEILAGPYVRVEEQAWLDAELDDDLAELYDAGAGAVARAIGRPPDSSVALLDTSIESDSLEWYVEQGVRGVLVPANRVTPLDRTIFDATLHRQFLIPIDDGGTVPALEADAQLARYFGDNRRPVLDANRMLADLTLIALEHQSLRRTAVVVAPSGWTPALSFVNVLLSGIERIPVIEPATAQRALLTTEFAPEAGDDTISPPLRRDLVSTRPEPLGSFRTDYNQAQAALGSWRTVLEAAPRDTTDQLGELLLVSTDQRHEPETQLAYIDTIYRLIDEQKNSALITPPTDTITLTGRQTELPLVVDNTLDVDLSVVLLLDSEKLRFPDGQEVAAVLHPGQNRVDVAIEALASGDSPIRVQIMSPDREVLLGSFEIVVRTLAFSGVGVFIGVAAILVLLMWWLRHRRATRATLASTSGEVQS